MGKIILIIYVIAAVVSIISKQRKKKRLQQSQNPAAKTHRAGHENHDHDPSDSPAEGIRNPWGGLTRRSGNDESVSNSSKIEKDREKLTDSDSRKSNPKGQQGPSIGKPSAGRDILLNVAKEFGIIFDDSPASPAPSEQGNKGGRSQERPRYQGQPEEVLTGQVPFSWEIDENAIEEDLEDSENNEEEFQSVYAERKLDKKGEGLAKSEPHVPPSLAYTLNSSKEARIIHTLRNKDFFKNAFILKTILDPPLALKNRARR